MHPTVVRFIVFFILSDGVTVLQLVLMPAFKVVLAYTSLVDTAFQFLPAGVSHGHTVFPLGYPAGLMSVGRGSGLAYFLAVEITLLIVQIISFFAQRNVTFKSNSSMGKAAFQYAVAYVIIMIAAAALRVLYRDPIYAWATVTVDVGDETFADVITMIINAVISFWAFSPILKVAFKQELSQEDAQVSAAQQTTDRLHERRLHERATVGGDRARLQPQGSPRPGADHVRRIRRRT